MSLREQLDARLRSLVRDMPTRLGYGLEARAILNDLRQLPPEVAAEYRNLWTDLLVDPEEDLRGLLATALELDTSVESQSQLIAVHEAITETDELYVSVLRMLLARHYAPIAPMAIRYIERRVPDSEITSVMSHLVAVAPDEAVRFGATEIAAAAHESPDYLVGVAQHFVAVYMDHAKPKLATLVRSVIEHDASAGLMFSGRVLETLCERWTIKKFGKRTVQNIVLDVRAASGVEQ